MKTEIEKNILINAPVELVWKYLTNPGIMKKWMAENEINLEIFTNWKVGSKMEMKGFHHVPFTNKGIVLAYIPYKMLAYNFVSSISNLSETTENLTRVGFILRADQMKTFLTLNLSNFPTESIYKHVDFYWNSTLIILKQLVEQDFNNQGN